MIVNRMLLLLLAVGLLSAAGCANKKEETKTTSQTSSAEPAAPAAEPTVGVHNTGEEAVVTDGSTADIFGRVRDEEQKLEQIIANSQLSEVHKKAFAIRDLVAAAADKATGLSGAQKSTLADHVAEVRTLAGELDESGDAGNLLKTKKLFAQMQVHLRATEKTLGLATR